MAESTLPVDANVSAQGARTFTASQSLSFETDEPPPVTPFGQAELKVHDDQVWQIFGAARSFQFSSSVEEKETEKEDENGNQKKKTSQQAQNIFGLATLDNSRRVGQNTSDSSVSPSNMLPIGRPINAVGTNRFKGEQAKVQPQVRPARRTTTKGEDESPYNRSGPAAAYEPSQYGNSSFDFDQFDGASTMMQQTVDQRVPYSRNWFAWIRRPFQWVSYVQSATRFARITFIIMGVILFLLLLWFFAGAIQFVFFSLPARFFGVLFSLFGYGVASSTSTPIATDAASMQTVFGMNSATNLAAACPPGIEQSACQFVMHMMKEGAANFDHHRPMQRECYERLNSGKYRDLIIHFATYVSRYVCAFDNKSQLEQRADLFCFNRKMRHNFVDSLDV